jgi:hypothetical protein
MDKILFEDQVEKFSLGRSTGLSSRNWKKRHLKVTRMSLSYSEKQGTAPKLEVPITAVSLLFTNPSPQDHPEAKGGAPFIMVRLHENGVFNLLFRAPSDEAKQKWIAAFTEALQRSKGSQIV